MKNYLYVGLAMSLFILSTVSFVQATPVYFTDRESFSSSVGISITDDYSGYSPGVLTNDQMNSVMGETRYEPITFPNQNQVGNVYSYGDGSNYCSGCNGNFKLFFDSTTLTVNGGVFGVGIDVVFHTSRHSSLGDIIPGDTVVDGQVLVEYSDGTFDYIIVPADIGFFAPEIFFIGITNDIGIMSITIGTEPTSLRHSWVIDNLTIAKEAPTTEPSIQLPKTGQTKCYDTAGTEIPCAGTGQDGDIQAGIAWPDPRFTVTLCDVNGPCANQSVDCDSDPSTDVITDNLTGLMWARDAGNPTAGVCSGWKYPWQVALDYVACLNSINYLGYSDWRLPNRNELTSLINRSEPNNALWLINQGFINVWNSDNNNSNRYWSSSTHAYFPGIAWFVLFSGIGEVDILAKDAWVNIWPVRSGKIGTISIPKTGQTTSYYAGDDGDIQAGVAWPDPRFYDNGDETVKDYLTGLIWTKDAGTPTVCSCTGGVMYWQQALDYVACLNSNNCFGHNDWRLPNIIELASIVNIGAEFNRYWLTAQGFINVYLSWYHWSSTTGASNNDGAWAIHSDTPHMHAYNKSSFWQGSFVWPVRGGTLGNSDISVAPTSYDFGSVIVGSSSAAQTFTISNTGTADLIVSSIDLSDITNYTIDKTGCGILPATITPGNNCTVTVTFSPSSIGTKNANLTINSDDPDTPTLNVPLSGTGIMPDISVSPTSYNFGNVVVGKLSAPQTFTISNTGTANLVIGATTLTGTNANQFSKQNDYCSGQTLAPSGSCTVQVKFSPTSLASKSATLSIPSNDPDENPLNVSLSGTAIAPAVTCSFTAYGTKFSRGSNLKFLAAFQNDTDEVQVFQFATKVTLPNGNAYPSSGWLFGPITVTLNPHESKSKLMTQFIPYNAPFGTYTYHGYVGTVSPPLLYNQCQFTFTVNP